MDMSFSSSTNSNPSNFLQRTQSITQLIKFSQQNFIHKANNLFSTKLLNQCGQEFDMYSVYLETSCNLGSVEISISQLRRETSGLSTEIVNIHERILDELSALRLGCQYATLTWYFINWAGAEAVGTHLATRIKATIEQIRGKLERRLFLKELSRSIEDHQWKFFMWPSFLKRNLEMETVLAIPEKASKIIDILAHLNGKISLLKPEIRQACKSLLDLPFRSHSHVVNSGAWVELRLVMFQCHQRSCDKYANDDCRNKALDFYGHFSDLLLFDYCLRDSPEYQNFCILVANVAVHGTLVSCQWWASQFDPTMEEDVIIAFSRLQTKINYTLPWLLYQMFRILKSVKETCGDQRFHDAARGYAQYVLPLRRRYQKIYWGSESDLPKVLIWELGSLTISIIPFLSDQDTEDEQSFFLEFYLLISEIEESSSCPVSEQGSLLLNFLGKVFLMKLEAFIATQLTASNDHLLLSGEKQIDALKKGLKEMKAFPEEHNENVNLILTLMEVASKLIASLRQSFLAKTITSHTVRTMLCLLRLKILCFKLEKLYDSKRNSLMLVVKDQGLSFLEGLIFLTNGLVNQQGSILMDGALEVAAVEAMTRSVLSFHQSILTQYIPEDQMLSDLQDGIEYIMSKLGAIFLPVPCSNFPKTNALSFFDALLFKLKELLLNCKASLFVSMKTFLEEIMADLEFFRHFLQDILKLSEKEIKEMGNVDTHIIDVAHEVEYLVDSIVCVESECHHWIWLYHLLQNTRHMKKRVIEFNGKNSWELKAYDVSQISSHVVSRASTSRIDDTILNLNDQENLILDQLLGGYPQRDIVSIVGMPGIGKTTLAKKVFSSPAVAYHFHIRAWCCVTKVYRKGELLLEILSQIIDLTDKIHGMSNEDLELKLRQLFLKNKYLIVMDDMWSSEAWDDLQASFPDDGNGSRILITSRLKEVAGIDKAHPKLLELQPLSKAESWNLLRMRIFGEESCPKELIEVGQKIAEACKGLPLAIVAIAGLLKGINRQQDLWKEIGKDINSQIIDNSEDKCYNILELSYKFLPDKLKACFLYFGAFLEDQEIPVKKLIRLWIAEGFVQKDELKSLEDVAEDYLKDLIGRSLVIFSQPRSGGGTKACRVHDMLRSLCQSIAKQDNFLHLVTRFSESNTPDDDLDFPFNDNSSNPMNNQIYEHCRLCFYSTRSYFTELRPLGPHARSLLFFATNNKYARSSYDISFISDNFRFLKVLDLEPINMGPSFPSGIELMVQLRYLAVSGDIKSVPSSIINLSNLETFVVKGLKGKVKLPDTIWCLKKLRHLLVNDVALIDMQDDKFGNSSALDCLITLTSPYLPYKKGTDKILSKFPNLRKLACIFSESPDWNGSINLFPRLEVLTQLESLKITYYGRVVHTTEFSFPFSLKKLTLSNFRLPWSEISVIGRLKNLQVLKLISKACDGETWEMVEGEFCNLKFLKLDTLNIARWDAFSDNFPKLEHLVLRNCKNLEEVPASFVEIPTLEIIDVQWCAKSAEESARRMRDEADEHLKIIIASDLNDKSLS